MSRLTDIFDEAREAERNREDRAEARDVLHFAPRDDENMKVLTVTTDLLTLDEAIESEFNIEPNTQRNE